MCERKREQERGEEQRGEKERESDRIRETMRQRRRGKMIDKQGLFQMALPEYQTKEFR